MTGYLLFPVYFFLGVLGGLQLCTLPTLAQEQTERSPFPDFTAPGIERFSAMIERPLFIQKRRPTDISQPQFSGRLAHRSMQKPTKTSFLLSGVVVNGAGAVALIKETQASETLKLSVGATIGGWIVTDIKPEQVWLRAGASVSLLSPRDNKMSDAEKQKILRIARVKRKLDRRKKRLAVGTPKPRQQIYGQAREDVQ